LISGREISLITFTRERGAPLARVGAAAHGIVLIRLCPGERVAKYFVYMLTCSDRSLYAGYTTDVSRRLARHNSGKASKYTRSRLPVVLSYLEETRTKGSALKREHAIKRLSRRAKLLLCSAYSKRNHSSR
jgi:putative endonuclease